MGAQQACQPADLAAIVNCGDDVTLHGLHISPDLDTIIYTLAGQINPATGWGLRDETWQAMDSLKQLGGEAWFNLGDQDLATHLYRTERLCQGASLTAIAGELAQAFGVELAVLPMSDDRVETRVTLAEPAPEHGYEAQEEVGFQEYFVKLQHSVAVSQVRFAGVAAARASQPALAALQAAEVVVLAPSNPVVSLGPLLALDEIRQLVEQRVAQGQPVVAISPLIGGRALKGPADRLLTELGAEASSAGIAKWYDGLLTGLIIDQADAHEAEAVRDLGIDCLVTDTDMSQPGVAAELAKLAFGLGQ